MKITFDNMCIGDVYTQKELASIWQYKSYDAIRRGIVTPAGQNLIILFVTEKKASYATQYKDQLVGNKLYLQGENKHGNDNRLYKNLKEKIDDIHLFYRAVHHTAFTYMGEVEIINADIKSDMPSEFCFKTRGD